MGDSWETFIYSVNCLLKIVKLSNRSFLEFQSYEFSKLSQIVKLFCNPYYFTWQKLESAATLVKLSASVGPSVFPK